MINLSFKLWLEGMEEYEPFRQDVDLKVGGRTRKYSFPFESWWPTGQDRVFIPMGDSKKSTHEQEIVDFLNDFKGVPEKGLPAATGYEIVDYKQGLARPINGKNSYKIMKVINGSLENDIRKLNAEKELNQSSDAKYKNDLKYIKSYHDDLTSAFQNDPYRASGTQFYTVISKNPHDLASMSTGRGWTSCMNLETGENKKTVWCELENGGFVAYMIRANDMNVQKPLARILIRRFDRTKKTNREIQSVAVPEDTIYGVENFDFAKLVKDWLREKQGEVSGRYFRKGGPYSDTFTGRKHSLFTYEINNENFAKTLNKYLNSNDTFKNSNNGVMIQDGLKNTILNDKSIALDDNTKKLLFGSMFPLFYSEITNKKFADPKNGYQNHFNYVNLPKFLMRFPEMHYDGLVKKYIEMFKSNINREEQYKLQDTDAINLLNQLYEKHPDFFDDDDLKEFELKVPDHFSYGTHHHDEWSPKALEKYREKVKSQSKEKLNVDRFKNSSYKGGEYYKFYNDLYGFINKDLHIFKPVPPEIVRQIITLWNNRDKLHELWKDDDSAKLTTSSSKGIPFEEMDPKETKSRVSLDLASKIIHLFNMTHTDIPLALNWVDEVINMKGVLNYHDYGYYLANLGFDNGQRFLPFLYKEKSRYESKDYERGSAVSPKDRIIESFNYIIDSIETGKPSKKYFFD